MLGFVTRDLGRRFELPGPPPPQASVWEQALPGFAVIAYGKFGGYELGYGSDLDLVFVYEPPDGSEPGAGAAGARRRIAPSELYARAGQRLIHWLSAHTPAGRLYEVDARLRPGGASGPLVTSMQALRRYQLEEAWTWEHQAIVRARPVAGPRRLGEAFRAMRREVLLEGGKEGRDPEA